MKPGHKGTANEIEPGHINSVFYRFKDLKMNVHYKITLIYRQPISNCMVAYLILVLMRVMVSLREGKTRRTLSGPRWTYCVNLTLGHGQSPKPLFSMFIYILQRTKVSPHI